MPERSPVPANGHAIPAYNTLKGKAMREFMFLFRRPEYDPGSISPAEMEALVEKWEDWIAGIAAQGKLVSSGQRLSEDGKVLRAGGVITDGPFVEIRERLGGYIVVKAANLDEAATLAHGCPVLEVNGSVELRPFFG